SFIPALAFITLYYIRLEETIEKLNKPLSDLVLRAVLIMAEILGSKPGFMFFEYYQKVTYH
ncbi:MAG: hypothetical protein PHH31_06300, partial [Acidaminococcaceae bacterium]|nr:hypothetical protein [Acidaminococcaceae bacterium]